MIVPAPRIREQITAVLSAWGLADDLVATTAEVMLDTDLAGVDSHGISMLMMYEEMWRARRIELNARPRVVRETAVTAVIDAGDGLGHPAGVAGMRLAIAKAHAAGVGVTTVFNSAHFGAAGYYAALAAAEGLIGLATTTARSVAVVPTRAEVPVLGTNPIAFAAPAGRNPPVVLDMSTSTVAANKVKVYELNGKPVPAGWVVDGQGRPVTDAPAAMRILCGGEAGGLTPLGGAPEMSSHKGYGLGVMVQLLSGALAGAAFGAADASNRGPGRGDNIGHFFLALDPKVFRPEGAFERDVDELVDLLHATRASDAAAPVLVPGDPEAASRAARLRAGVPLPDTLVEKIRAVCERSGAPFVLEPSA
jgi:LDH2 family malate/lactate/ureidoglycolate dehydrogenase